MNGEYVEKVNGAFRIAGSRVSLDSVVYQFLEGHSPETIRENFPTLSLEQVYGAITFYLAHRAEVDDYLRQGDAEFEKLRERTRETNRALAEKMERARRLSHV